MLLAPFVRPLALLLPGVLAATSLDTPSRAANYRRPAVVCQSRVHGSLWQCLSASRRGPVDPIGIEYPDHLVAAAIPGSVWLRRRSSGRIVVDSATHALFQVAVERALK